MINVNPGFQEDGDMSYPLQPPQQAVHIWRPGSLLKTENQQGHLLYGATDYLLAGLEGSAHGVSNKTIRKGEAMVKAILGILIILLASLSASAQMSSGYVYVFGGPVVVPQSAFTRWNGDFIHVGGGGEGHLTDRFALGGEIGVLKPVTNQYARTTGLASVTPAFHFISRESERKFDPFVDGGVSLLAGGGGGAVAIHYGGGMNYWLRRRIGLRFEFRHHIWSPEAGEAVHLVGFRVGMVFGTS